MSSKLEGIAKDSNDHKKEYDDASVRSKEITDSRKKTLEGLSVIDSMDEEVTEAVRAANQEVKIDAKTDFRSRVEALMEKVSSDVNDTKDDIAESVNESAANKNKLESVAGGSDYGAGDIRSAAGKADQMGRAYADVGNDLDRAARASIREVSDRKREIDS